MFSTKILEPLFLKAEASAQAQLAITLLYILFANILTWYYLETYIEDTLDKWGRKIMS